MTSDELAAARKLVERMIDPERHPDVLRLAQTAWRLCDEVERLQKGLEAMNLALGQASDEIIKLHGDEP